MSAVGNVDTSTLGAQTITVTETDRAGHVTVTEAAYTIVRPLVIVGPDAPLAVGGTASLHQRVH